MSYEFIEPPSAEPITLEQARYNLRLGLEGLYDSPPDADMTAQNAFISKAISAARRQAEAYTERLLTDALCEARFSCLGYRPIALPVASVGSVERISYLDAAELEQDVPESVYYFERDRNHPRVWLRQGQSWPVAARLPGAYRIRFRGMYGGTESPPLTVPENVAQAMHLMVAHWWTNRAAVMTSQTWEVPLGATWLMDPERANLGV